MNIRKTFTVLAAILLFSLSACDLQINIPVPQDILPTAVSLDAVGTAVARTLNAQPGVASPGTEVAVEPPTQPPPATEAPSLEIPTQTPTPVPPTPTATDTATKVPLLAVPSLVKNTKLPALSLLPTNTPTKAKLQLAKVPSLVMQPIPLLRAPNTTCNKLSLYLDPVLASGSTCDVFAEGTGPDGPTVNVDRLTLQGYILSNRFHTPHVEVFSIQSLQQAAPDFMNAHLPALQALINGAQPGNAALPFLPIFAAAQEFHAQYKVVSFARGSGIRYLTQYAQFYDPINNHDMFYTFQGLTSDGKYWIAAILPISNPILPANGDNPPNGQSWEEFGNGFDAYIADIISQLNAQNSGSFSPSLAKLDEMVSSISIQP